MLFTVDYIRGNCAGAYAELPSLLKANLGDFLVFKYRTIYETGAVEVLEVKSMPTITLGIYKVKGEERNIDVSYFKSPFDSRSFILYQILLSLAKDKADEIRKMYEGFRLRDVAESKKVVNESISNYDEIYSAETFRSAITKYIFGINKIKIVDELCALADIIHGSYEKSGRAFYCGRLEKVISALQDNNGDLIPDNLRATVHYMLVGGMASITGADGTLVEAKRLLHSNIKATVIYDVTGWFYNGYDEKWRKQISDAESSICDAARIMDNEIFSSANMVLYLNNEGKSADISPMGVSLMTNEAEMTEEDILWKKKILAKTPYLPQVMPHPTLYKEYPFLAYIKCFYASNSEKDSYSHFHSSKENIIVTVCNPTEFNRHTVLLHEVQHAIQSFENWSRGGNGFVAQLGMENSQSLRDYIQSLALVEHIFSNANEGTLKSVSLILGRKENESVSAAELAPLFFLSILNEYKYIVDFTDAVSIEQYELLSSAILKAKSIAELGRKYATKLSAQGYSGAEMNLMVFKAYEMLLGELEARYTQRTALSKDVNDYFLPLSAETYKDEDVVIYSDEYKIAIAEKKNFLAAIESYEGKFTMHLRPTRLAEPIAHEIGHILYDDFVSHSNLFSIFMSESNGQPDFEEHFVQCYLNYLKRKSSFSILASEIKSVSLSAAVDRFLDVVFMGANPSILSVGDASQYIKFLKLMNE